MQRRSIRNFWPLPNFLRTIKRRPTTGYRLVRALGGGGDGIVFLAESTENDLCAVKIFHEDCVAQQDSARELTKGLRAWIGLGSHPFLVEASACGYYLNRVALVMEYVPPDQKTKNTSLQEYICNSGGAFSVSLALHWTIQVCCAMEHANLCGVAAHGDIKPSNVLITADKNAKLTDFGCGLTGPTKIQSISGKGSDQSPSRWPLLASGGFIRGTPGYIPPEAYQGVKVGVRSDVFSLGVVLWQLATGRKVSPFVDCDRPSSFDSICRKVSTLSPTGSPLDPIIQRCLSQDPTTRFEDFSCLRQQLQRLVD
jgi:eukaryotic-like serine/threonine-protein kinase